MAGDVLEENKSSPAFPDDASHMRPEVARVVSAAATACGAERLARVSRNDEIHASTPRCAVEGGEVRPDRSLIHGAVLHTRDQDGGRVGFPLHETDGSCRGAGESDAEVESADAGAEGQYSQAMIRSVHHASTADGWLLWVVCSSAQPSRLSHVVGCGMNCPSALFQSGFFFACSRPARMTSGVAALIARA